MNWENTPKESELNSKLTEEEDSDPLGIRGKLPLDYVHKNEEHHRIFFTREDFNPEVYLSLIHKDSSFQQLKDGSVQLRKKLESRTESLKLLVRDNFNQFVSCKDTIDSIHITLKQHESASFGTSKQLASTYAEIFSDVQKIYNPILDRKQEAEKIRKQLKIINSYQLIFSMPVRLRKNIAAEKYEKVLSDYKKLLRLIGDSQISVFQRIKNEVENIITEFISTLFKELEDISKPLDETKKIIQLLMEFGPKDDPAWHYVANSKNKMCEMINKPSKKSSEKTIKDLCKLILYNLPKHWKLTEAVLSGEFIKAQQARALMSHQSVVTHTEVEYKELVTEVLTQYSDKVNELFEDIKARVKEKLSSELFALMKDICMELGKTYDTLKSLQMPRHFYKNVNEMISDITLFFVSSILQHLYQEISTLHLQEDWEAEKVGDNTVTKLPDNFMGLTQFMFSHLDGIIYEDHVLMPKVKEGLFEVIRTFADSLHALAFPPLVLQTEKQRSGTISSAPKLEENKIAYRETELLAKQDRELVLILSNSFHLRTVLLQELDKTFRKTFRVSTSLNFESVTSLYLELESMVVNKYIRHKTLGLNAFIKNGILCSGIDWLSEDPPTEAGKHVLEALLMMVFVHNEVSHTLEPKIANFILSRLTRNIFQAFLDSLAFISHFSPTGLRRFEIDVQFAEKVLKNYIEESNSLLDELHTAIEYAMVIETKKSKEPTFSIKQMVNKALTETRVMFQCFA